MNNQSVAVSSPSAQSLTANPALVRTHRLASLDALRGLNIAAMVLVHYVGIYYSQPSTPFSAIVYLIWGYVAPLFLYLAGAGTWFFFRTNPPSKLMKRGIFLSALTLAISIFPKGHLYIEWTLIQDVGFAFIVMAVIAFISPHRLLGTTLVCLLCSVFFSWFGLTVEGVFPIFPIGLYFLIGYGYACLCNPRPAENVITCQAIVAALTAAIVCGLGVLSNPWTQGTPLALYSDLATTGGVFMLLYFFFVYVLGSWEFKGALGEFILLMGRFSLTSYYIQQVLLRLSQRFDVKLLILGPFLSSVGMTTLIFVVIYGILKVWSKFDFVFSLEWGMRRL
jgi:uncharacterized membrane protein